MEGVIGTMKILIEGDAAGLTSQLKRAGSSITKFVGEMNKQEVNWTSILSRTISPAIISGIAATFALALTESLNFGNVLAQTANTSTEAFATNSKAATDSALAIQASTGQSAESVTEAMGIATRALGSYSAGQALVAEASKYALVTGIPLLDLINELIPVMQEWGITDAPKIASTIQDLFGAAEQGRVSIGDLLKTMADTGPMLRGKTSIEEASASLEAFSNQAGNTAPTAMKVFETLANAAFGDIQTQAKLSALGVGSIKAAVEDGGMAKAINNLETSFSKMATSTQIILGNNAGFDNTTVGNLAQASKSHGSIAADSKKIMDNEAIIGGEILKNVSPTQKLQVAWGAIKSDLEYIVNESGFIDWLSNALTYIDKLFNHPWNTLKDTFSSTKSIGTAGLTVGGAGAGAMVGGAAGATIGSVVPIVGTAIGGALGAIFGALAGAFGGNTLAHGISNAVGNGNQSTVNNYNNTTNISPNMVGGQKGSSFGLNNSSLGPYYGYLSPNQFP